ncbi:MAG: FAD-binding oxidoreductase [Candidatus Saccharimonadales bacterium]
MDSIITALKMDGFLGDISTDQASLERCSHDASMFELRPQLVLAPKDSADVSRVVNLVAGGKHGDHSIVVRSAGTDMSGGAIGESIVLDMTPHFTTIHSVTPRSARVQPGVYYRDFEQETLKQDALLPCYPASKDLCTLGGMVANNSGGEKSLQYGKTEQFVPALSVILADGNEYSVKPLHKAQLKAKMAQKDYEGRLYTKVYQLLEEHYDAIKAAKPQVSKDSTGYHLWNVWDRETGIFDMTQLIVGSQGTLGIVTDVHLRLVPAPKHSGTLVVFLRDIRQLGKIINTVREHEPATFEGFDNYTLMLSFKLFYYFHHTLGWLGTIKLGLELLPDLFKLFRGIPKMVLLVEFNGDTPEEVSEKVHAMRLDLRPFDSYETYEEDASEEKARKFWIMRRESFNLLRQKVKDKHTAPFIDDLVVPPEVLPKFLPQLRKILKKYKLLATIAGHMGDGNFHIIPLMKIEDPKEVAKIKPVMKAVNELVLQYGGSLSGEHNDGLSRGPWLKKMYGPEVYGYFVHTKHIFDPDNIFNPKKKTDATWDYSMSHLRKHF